MIVFLFFSQFSLLFTTPWRAITVPVGSLHGWSQRLMETYQPDASINNEAVMAPFQRVKSPQTRNWLQVPWRAQNGKSRRGLNDVHVGLWGSHNDLIGCRKRRRLRVERTYAHLIKGSLWNPSVSLRGPCPTFLGLQSASFSDSHSFLLLLFFIYLIAFHFPPLLGPPLSVKPTPPPFHFALPSLPSSSPPNVPFVIFYRPPPPPPPPPWPSPSDTSGCNFRTIRRERCLYLLNCTLIFSYSCQGTHSYRDVFVLSSRCSSVRLYPGGGYVGERRLRRCSGCTQRRAGLYAAN